MLEMKAFNRLFLAMLVCLGFLSLVVIGDAQSHRHPQLKKVSPHLRATKSKMWTC